MRRYTLKLLALLLVFGLMSLTACSKNTDKTVPGQTGASSGKEQAVTEEKVVNVIVSDPVNPELFSPLYSSGGAFQLWETVYDPLVRYGYHGVIEPGLAERWEISEDGNVYTFYLRQDVKFSDGTNFNADSVIENAARWIPDSFSTPLILADKIDEFTVALTFQNSSYPLLTELTFPRPYRIAGANAFDGEKFTQMIGTGPWMVSSYVADEKAELVPNPYYYGEKPKVDKLIFRTVSDGQSRMMALQSHEADISLSDLPSESSQLVEQNDNLDFLTVDGTMGFYFMFNQDNPVFQDENIRKAFNYALDKETIARDIFNGAAIPAAGVLPDTVPYVTAENSPGYGYSIEKAKQALSEAGYKDEDGDGIVEKDGVPLSVKLVFQTEEYAAWKYLCEYVQAEMKNVGIDIQLDLRESAAYYDAIWTTRDFDMIIYRTYEDSWNPHGFLRSLFYQLEGSPAISWYDPDLNKLLDEVILIKDEQKRQEKYDEIFRLINDKAMCIPICYPKKMYAYNTRLTNLKPAPTTYESLRWDQIDKK